MAPKFGTSGLRGLVTELTDDLCATYARAFLRACGPAVSLLVGRDLRPSSPRIAAAVTTAALELGIDVTDCGELSTPALAAEALRLSLPAIMVTGSHIPADRNGLKFYSATGEITKADEEAITRLAQDDRVPVPGVSATCRTDGAVAQRYLDRYLAFYGPGALDGLRIGVYQHSSVARDMLVDIVERLGAKAVPLGRSDHFIPVDTEAVDEATRNQLRIWATSQPVDAIISADGDADRPLLTNAAGEVIAGDILDTLTALALGADTVVTPVSSNTMVEATGAFAKVLRTRIGSPYVIAGIEQALKTPCKPVGFEANGGFLLGFDVLQNQRTLPRLLTRDAVLPILAVLAGAARRKVSIADMVSDLPERRTATDRLEHVPTERSAALVRQLTDDAAARAAFFSGFGPETRIDLTDGLRVAFESGLILHVRPSGNAPELRGYAEASSDADARHALADLLDRLRQRIG